MIISTTPDKEKAKSILNLIGSREKFVKTINSKEFTTIKVENYYEIAKELITAIILCDGFKSVGENAYKELLEWALKNRIMSEGDTTLLQDLRIKRNKSSYEGKQIDYGYLENNEKSIIEVINNLKSILIAKI